MKKVISSVLIFSLVLTIFASALPVNQSNSVKISDEQMMEINGGCNATAWWVGGALAGTLGLAAAVTGFGLGAVPVIYGASVAMLARADSCGGGGDKNSDMRTSYHFKRVN